MVFLLENQWKCFFFWRISGGKMIYYDKYTTKIVLILVSCESNVVQSYIYYLIIPPPPLPKQEINITQSLLKTYRKIDIVCMTSMKNKRILISPIFP